MASPTGSLIPLNKSDRVKMWIRCFADSVNAKMLKDDKVPGEVNKITAFSLTLASCEVIKKISVIVHYKELKNKTFSEIADVIKNAKKCYLSL